MIISKVHAVLLDRVVAARKSGRGYLEPHTYEERFFYELEIQGLVRRAGDSSLMAPTYLGEELAYLLCKQAANGVIARPSEWGDSWRWIGSEIVHTIEHVRRKGELPAGALDQLVSRGFAACHIRGTGHGDPVTLTDAGLEVSDIYRALEPGLHITAGVADVIRSTPAGPVGVSRLTAGPHTRNLLEAMRLIVYSIPNARRYVYTRLGRAIRSTLLASNTSSDRDYFTSEILLSLAAVARGHRIPRHMRRALRELGYSDANGALLPAGEYGLEVYRLWHRESTDDDLRWSVSMGELAEPVSPAGPLSRTSPRQDLLEPDEVMVRS